MSENRSKRGSRGNPVKSVEGWILMVTGVHEEAQDDDVMDKFLDYGQVINMHMNLERRTGYVKGYALVQYKKREEAERAIRKANNSKLLGKKINVTWAFENKGQFVRPATTIE
eukprot:g3342.t1